MWVHSHKSFVSIWFTAALCTPMPTSRSSSRKTRPSSCTASMHGLALPCRMSSPVQSCSCPTVHGCFPPACLAHCPSEEEGRPVEVKVDYTAHTSCSVLPVLLLLSVVTVDLYSTSASAWLTCPHLAGVHRCWDKGRLWEELGGSQQVTDPLVIPLVVFYGLYVHLFFGQQSLITGRITGRWQELKISVSPSQQEPDPEIITWRCVILFNPNLHQNDLFQIQYMVI